jgi:Helix-turn-helix domain/Protein of unknown function (DUF2914)
VSLETVAEATRIPRRHLQALERGDLASLPAGPFAKGYIRAYAEFLGIDPRPTLEAHHSEERRRGMDTPEAESRMLEELSRLVQHRVPKAGFHRRFFPPRKGLIPVAVLAAGVVGFAAWFLGRAPRAPVPVPTTPAQQAQASAAVAVEAEAAAEPAPPRETPKPAAPAAVTRAATAPAPSRPNPNLRVSDSGVGSGIQAHRLVGMADRFETGTNVAFWTRVVGGRPGDVIRHVWFHEGQAIMRTDLSLGSANWRTYSRYLLDGGGLGRWTVEARGPEGELLARQEFLCVTGGR